MADEIFETEIYTLTDDEGVENDFELIGTIELEGVTYYALVPYTEDENAEIDEYIVLRGEKDENGEDVVASYTYFDNKGNSFTLTAEEAHNIQIKIIAEGAQTATFENAYDALNTAFGVPGTYNPWN